MNNSISIISIYLTQQPLHNLNWSYFLCSTTDQIEPRTIPHLASLPGTSWSYLTCFCASIANTFPTFYFTLSCFSPTLSYNFRVFVQQSPHDGASSICFSRPRLLTIKAKEKKCTMSDGFMLLLLLKSNIWATASININKSQSVRDFPMQHGIIPC